METVDKINENKPCVFLSYHPKDREAEATGGFLSQLESTLSEKGFEVIDDPAILERSGSIYDFMQEEGLGKFVITVLSNSYLQSKDCMLVFNEIVRGTKEFSNRFFPVMLSDVNLLSEKERTKYIQYWKEETQKLEESIKGAEEPSEQNMLWYDLHKYGYFKSNLNHILDFLSAVNTPVLCDKYEDVIQHLSKSLEVKTKIDSEQVKLHEPSY